MAYIVPKVFMAGGAANSDIHASLGGAMSSTEVVSANFDNASPITGVTLLNVVGYPNQTFTMSFQHTVSSNIGRFSVYDSLGQVSSVALVYQHNDGTYKCHTFAPYRGYVEFDVDTTLMDWVTEQVVVGDFAVTNIPQGLFYDTTHADVEAARSVYRCIYIEAQESMGTPAAYVMKNYDNPDLMEVAIDPSGVNGTALTIADEYDSTNQLSGLAFTSADNYSDGTLVGSNLSAGDTIAIWVKRTSTSGVFVRSSDSPAVCGIGYVA